MQKLQTLLIIAFLCVPPVLSDDSRDLSVSVSKDEVEVESKSKINSAKDYLNFKLSSKSEGLKVDVQSEAKDKEEEDKNKVKLTVYFDKIVQYQTGGTYNRGATVGDDYLLGEQNWQDFDCPQNNGKYICTAATQDGVVSASFEFSGSAFQTDGISLSPNDIKISVSVNGFNYANADANIRLALHAYGIAKVQYTDHQGAQTSELISTGTSAFSWLDTCTIDGAAAGVGTSSIDFSDNGDKKFDLYFSFLQDRPTSIYWDPTVTAGADLLRSTLLALCAIIGVMMF